MRNSILNSFKNLIGWKTNRKIVVISVDDYGNVRLDSNKARKYLLRQGCILEQSHFDKYDTLETREDIEALFEVLSLVKDKHNNPAVFTPFALCCNINFENMMDNGYERYEYELLPETYQKLSEQQPKAYKGTWSLWQQGIEEGLMRPQFHGREHFNLKAFVHLLKIKDKTLLKSLATRSNISIQNTGFSEIKYTAAFAFQNVEELDTLKSIAIDGVKRFEEVFGYKPIHFMAPTANVHVNIIESLQPEGVFAFDRGKIQNNHLGNGKYKKSYNYTGKVNSQEQISLVRNVVFEPTTNKSAVDIALKQVEAAFFWKAPAIISSHRVNFCGHIDPENRRKGLNELKNLLQQITKKWPDVEFLSSEQLIHEIRKSKNLN